MSRLSQRREGRNSETQLYIEDRPFKTYSFQDEEVQIRILRAPSELSKEEIAQHFRKWGNVIRIQHETKKVWLPSHPIRVTLIVSEGADISQIEKSWKVTGGYTVFCVPAERAKVCSKCGGPDHTGDRCEEHCSCCNKNGHSNAMCLAYKEAKEALSVPERVNANSGPSYQTVRRYIKEKQATQQQKEDEPENYNGSRKLFIDSHSLPSINNLIN